MLSCRNWVTEFIGYVLRRGLSDDPDSVFDTAGEMYSEWSDLDPDVAADSAFGPEGEVSLTIGLLCLVTLARRRMSSACLWQLRKQRQA